MKRFWWVVVICALLGSVVGLSRAKPATFTSRSTLQIDTPSNSAESQDRRVATEVGRLSSAKFAGQVASAMRNGMTSDDIQRDVIVTNASGSDLVDIVVNAKTGPLAKKIASTYVDTYMKLVAPATQGTQSAALASLNLRLRDAQSRLTAINDEIDAAGGRANATLASEQATYQSLVNSLTTQIAATQPADSGGSATVVEPGTDPRPSGKGKIRSVAPFALAALFAGVLLAVVLARLSGRVLDGEEVEEILGVPVHGRLPKEMSASVRSGGWWNVPPETAAFLEELCTRVESSERRGSGLTVLVAGSESTTNSIPLAALMSSRFGSWGLDVVFGGADGQASDLFNRLGRPRQNLTGVIAEADSETTTRLRQLPRSASDDLTPASHQLTFVGMSDEADALALRRYGPEAVLAILADAFDVVVLAVGPLLEARAAAQLAQLADVVVLAVPVEQQSRKRLQAVARQLANRRGELVVVDDRDGKGAPGSVADYTRGFMEQTKNAEDAAPFPAKESPIERPGSIGGSA